MKKNYLIVIIAMILLLSYFDAKAQCDYCQAPRICYTFTFNTGLQFPCNTAQATICYQCGVTSQWINADIIELNFNSNCRQYEDRIWDSAYAWISYNVQSLCGSRPCTLQPKMEVYITKPICGEVRCEGNPRKLYYRARPGDCDRRCYSKYLWCFDYETGQRDWDHQWSQIVGNGTCEPQERPPCDPNVIPWIIGCDLIINPIRCP